MGERYHVEDQLTVNEVAQRLRVNPSTVWRWIKGGKLKQRKLGRRIVRIPASEVNAFLEAREV